MKLLFPLLVLLLIGQFADAQRLDHVQGQFLVQARDGADLKNWIRQHQSYQGTPTGLQVVKKVSEPADIWLVAFDHTRIPERSFLQTASRSADIAHLQLNHLVSLRSTIPDDPLFDQQWQYLNTGQSGGTPNADIDADLAWDITTGGLTFGGDTIVVCAIDGGLDLNHQDFGDNHWRNWAEIPDNGIDDDNNGYIDDFLGWNSNSDSDDIQDFGGHGTAVAGIIGAQGNNGLGVTGVNWDVQVMVVRNDFNTTEANVLQAYSYALSARKRYNETGGAEGAFVVATNASWGVDFGQPEESPLWCAFYDSLGQAGILNCGATINGNQNVDEVGDLPTACPSEYLIAVTNMNDLDQKVGSAGFGPINIDLGAPGAGAFNATTGNSYSPFGGTSGATPHVTGTIGLLYSAPCPNLVSLVDTDPAAAALLVRQAILDGVDPNPSLDGITATGGRLNVYGAMQALFIQCGGCLPPVSPEIGNVLDTSVQIRWNSLDSVETVNLRIRPADQSPPADWDTLGMVSSPLVLNGLSGCTAYEVQFQSICADDTTDFTTSTVFQTEGCCEPPSEIDLVLRTDSSAVFSWNAIFGATAYTLRYRAVGESDWNELSSITPGLAVNDLQACTDYELQIRSRCGDITGTDWSQLVTFTTLGCGACLDLIYCLPEGFNTRDEWIDSIQVHTLSNASGDNSGYGDFTGDSPLEMQAGTSYPVYLAPGFSGNAFEEFFRIWIDLNRDGAFDSSEVVFSSPSSSMEPVSGELFIPPGVPPGTTRMRIGMKFLELGEEETCEPEGLDFGEMEDYCIELQEALPCEVPALNGTTIGNDFVSISWDPVPAASQYELSLSLEDSVLIETFTTADTTFGLAFEQLDSCSSYLLQVASQCAGSTSAPTLPLFFDTPCISSIADPAGSAGLRLGVIPNPVAGPAITYRLFLQEGQQQVTLELWSLDGRLLQRQNGLRFAAGETYGSLPAGALPPGLYLLRLQLPDGRFAVQRVVVR